MARPNVLIFFTDDQRYDTIAALGNDQILTPNMDRLVARGVAFTQAHIPGGTVPAVCMPSRAMLHSGRTLFGIQGSGQEIPADHVTLGETFRRAGYRTFAAGKWHNGTSAFHRSFSEGDEIFFGGMADHWNVPAYHYDPMGKYAAVCLATPDPMSSNKTVARRCDHIHAGRHSTDTIAEATVAFLNTCDASQPFLAYASFLAPHDPRTMPQRFREMYKPEEIRLPDNFMPAHPFDNGELHVRDEKLAAMPRTGDEIRRHLAEYYAMITHLDFQLGRIVEVLTERGLLENTIIVLAGDNGLAIGRHGLMGKQSVYEHSVRVPLVFAGPGIPAGASTESFAYLLDIFPTLCDLAGLDVPASVQGQSLAPTLADPSKPAREELYLAYSGKHRGVKNRRYKLIEYVLDGRRSMTQLFDLQSDPSELCNLADCPQHQAVVSQMRASLGDWARRWGDEQSTWGQTFWSAWRQEAGGGD